VIVQAMWWHEHHMACPDRAVCPSTRPQNNFRCSSRLLQPRADDPIDDVAAVLADVVTHAAE